MLRLRAAVGLRKINPEGQAAHRGARLREAAGFGTGSAFEAQHWQLKFVQFGLWGRYDHAPVLIQIKGALSNLVSGLAAGGLLQYLGIFGDGLNCRIRLGRQCRFQEADRP
jgi:hypothetical protein